MYNTTGPSASLPLHNFFESPRHEQITQALRLGFDTGLAIPELLAIFDTIRLDANAEPSILDGEVIACLIDAAHRHIQFLPNHHTDTAKEQVAFRAADIAAEVCCWLLRHGEIAMVNDAVSRLIEALPEVDEERLLQ